MHLRIALLLLSSVTLPAQDPHEVLADRHPLAGDAIYSSVDGLLLRAPARPDLRLGTAADARFAPDGSLWFARSVDAGHEEIGRVYWVLPAGAPAPRPARPGEILPALPAPRRPETAAVRVCVDPGHGGGDPGALGNGLREADVNLDVVLRLVDLLRRDSLDPSRGGVWEVLATRTADVDVSLGQRTSAANAFGAASFVSVHMNAFSSSTANGTETFCYTGTANGPSGGLRDRVQAEALAAWRLTDRGGKTANFYVLRQTNMPAALLEGGFVTNPGDAAVMADPARRQALARAVLFALQRHHGFPTWDPGTAPPSGILRGVVYDGSRGPTAPVAGALVAVADGTFTSTDAAGSYSLTLPAAPAVRIAVTAPGFDPAHATRAILAGGSTAASFGLPPAAVPALTFRPVDPRPGIPFVAEAAADVGSPAWLLLGLAPAVPPVDARAQGLGFVWPDLAAAISLPLGTGNPTGTALGLLPSPAVPGLVLHGQALVFRGGVPRLTNGAAVRIR
jgi:N-acetylmuramoyl-L-alanine amidase